MNTGTIIFHHNIKMNNGILSMDECFVPYNKDVLLSLVTKDNTVDVWDGMLTEENYDYSETNYSEWVDGGSDYKSASLWDYLAEVNAIYTVYKYCDIVECREKTEKLAKIYMLSRMYLDIAKVDLSVIMNSSWNIGNREFEHDLLQYYDWVVEILTRRNEDRTERREFDWSATERMMRYSSLRTCVREIGENVNILLALNVQSDSLCENIQKSIKGKFNKMLGTAGQAYVERKRFLNRLNAVHHLKLEEDTIFHMSVSSDEYNDQRAYMIDKIRHNVRRYNNMIPEIEDMDFEAKFKELCKFFEKTIRIEGKTTVGKKVLKKYQNDRGCFAIMKETNGDTYFAFSNVLEYEKDAKRIQYEILAREVMEKVFDENVGIGDVRTHGHGYNWAYLTDDVLRYYQLGIQHEQEGVLEGPKRMGEDIKGRDWEKEKGKIGRTYACCERKILAFSKGEKEKTFFSRWSPCFKCRPALEKKNIRIFALSDDFETWLKEKKFELKEYKIVRRYRAARN